MSPEDSARTAERRRLLALAGLAAAVAAAFWAGRASGPSRTEERVRVETVEVTKEVIVTQERVRVETVEVKQEARTLIRTEREYIYPDGTITRERREEDSSQASSQLQSAKENQTSRTSEAQTASNSALEQYHEVTRDRASWRLGGSLGIDIPEGVSRPAWVGGGTAAARLGPFWLGLFAQSNGVAGLLVELEF